MILMICVSQLLRHQWAHANPYASCAQDAASLRPEAAGLLQQACRNCSSCYVLACVESDVGRAAVYGAFEAAGLLGPARDQLRPHRHVLICQSAQLHLQACLSTASARLTHRPS